MRPLIILFGATASGKTALSLALAQRFSGEILSCDSVAVYRHMELGTAKPTLPERALIPHHGLDLCDPTHPCTAGDYARHARESLTGIASRNALPIVAGGTGLYLRALTDGLFPAPLANYPLRQLLRNRAASRGPQNLHRTLQRLDPKAAQLIHPNDTPKLIRAIEVSLPSTRQAARTPITEQWANHPRDPLTGFRILRLGLNPPRPELYHRINHRAAAMFQNGLVEETRTLIARFGPECRPFTSLGYAQATAVLNRTLTLEAAIAQAQQGHRNYAKRQLTWFRRDAEQNPTHWLQGTGDDPEIQAQATSLLVAHLAHPST